MGFYFAGFGDLADTVILDAVGFGFQMLTQSFLSRTRSCNCHEVTAHAVIILPALRTSMYWGIALHRNSILLIDRVLDNLHRYVPVCIGVGEEGILSSKVWVVV